MAIFEPKKSKNKDIYNDENLLEAPMNEVLYSLPRNL